MGSLKPFKISFSAHVAHKSTDFWTISGRLLGPKIVQQSINIGSKRLSISDAFSDLRFQRFCIRFDVENGSPKQCFFALGSQRLTLQKLCFSIPFYKFFEVWGSRNLLKNNRGTKLAFQRVSDSVSGRFFDDFGAPKRSKNESGT